MATFPTTPVAALKYVELGQIVQTLFYEKGVRVDWVSQHMKYFIERMDLLGFTYAKEEFQQILGRAAEIQEKMEPVHWQLGLPQEITDDLHKLLRPTWEIIRKESDKRHVIVLNDGGVTPKLRELPRVLALTDPQKQLVAEAVCCFEAGAYRSAIVNGWNLAYDFIRQWVFDRHLGDFNATLTANYLRRATGDPIYERIDEYTDFLKTKAPSEAVVLEVCKDANKIPGKVHDTLVYHLRGRNEYAHPSDSEPSPNQANAYVEELVKLITRAPFK